jgi:hypothetical protein
MSSLPEVDLGRLSPAELAFGEPSSAEDREIAWALDQLARAAKLRGLIERTERGSHIYADMNFRRVKAIAGAHRHVARLTSLGYPIPPEIVEAMRAEGEEA